MRTTRNQTRDVSHVGDQNGSYLVGNLSEFVEFQCARVGGRAGPDDLRLVLLSQSAHLSEIDSVVILVHPVGVAVEKLTGNRHTPTVGQVATGGQSKPEHRVSRLAKS